MKETLDARPARVTLQWVVRCASRLTDRDRQIALDCYDHHVLTTGQLQRLHFPSVRAACGRLRVLYLLRVLDRFQPPWERGQGSTPWQWILDETGAYIVAEQLGIERKELNWRRATALAIAASAKLSHHIQVNEFFSRLAFEAAAQGGALTGWYGERATQRLFQGRVTPDGYGC
jgi:Replication-relaxation